MNRLMTLALGAALVTPTALSAQPATSIAVRCEAGPPAAGSEAPNLHGNWDFLFDAAGTPNFGLMSIGVVDGAYGGTVTPAATAPVVVREIVVTGDRIRMAVASSGGDVLFDGRLSARGDRMCGTVTYHDGRIFPMVAQKRPSTYQSRLPAQRTR